MRNLALNSDAAPNSKYIFGLYRSPLPHQWPRLARPQTLIKRRKPAGWKRSKFYRFSDESFSGGCVGVGWGAKTISTVVSRFYVSDAAKTTMTVMVKSQSIVVTGMGFWLAMITHAQMASAYVQVRFLNLSLKYMEFSSFVLRLYTESAVFTFCFVLYFQRFSCSDYFVTCSPVIRCLFGDRKTSPRTSIKF